MTCIKIAIIIVHHLKLESDFKGKSDGVIWQRII